jgi:hypothetical protein
MEAVKLGFEIKTVKRSFHVARCSLAAEAKFLDDLGHLASEEKSVYSF